MTIFTSLLGAVFETFIINMFFSKFGAKKLNSTAHFIVCIAFAALQTLIPVIAGESIFVFIFAILFTFLFCCFFNIKLPLKIVISIAYSIIMALSETAIVLLTTVGLSVDVPQIQSVPIMYVTCILLAKFLAFAIFKLIKVNKWYSDKKLSYKFLLCVFILPFSSIFIIILLYRCAFLIENINFQISAFFATILLIISNILIFYIIDKQEDYILTEERLTFAESQIRNQITHYNELYEQQQELKRFKHDSKNIYIALLAKLKTMSPEEAIHEIQSKMNLVYNMSTQINSGNPVIDAVIQAKISIAEKYKIKISVSVKIMPEIKIDELELAVLLGNALDNAIEATHFISQENEKLIFVNIVGVDEMLSVKITNPVTNAVNTDKLVTTKVDKKNHGYGINGIKSIVEKYAGFLDITCENGIFTLSAMLVNKQII